MRKLLLPLSAILIMSLFMVSCVNKDYRLLGDIDLTIGGDMTLVGPVGHSKVKLFEVLPDSFQSYAFKYDGENIYLSMRDTQHLGNDIIGHLKMYPKGEFEINADVSIDPGEVHKGSVDMAYTFYFDDINTNPNERLDSILLKDDNKISIKVACTVPLQEGSYIELSFDEQYVTLDKTLYPDNSQRFEINDDADEIELDLNKALLRFNGTNYLKINLKGGIHSQEPIPSPCTLTLTLKYDDIKPRITYGYLGPDRIIYETTKTIPFAYTKEFESTGLFLPFYNPQIALNGRNSIGIPALYKLDYVKVYNSESGEEVYADFNGSPNTEFVLNCPDYSEIKGLSVDELLNFDTESLEKESSFLLDREFGHTERLFKINGQYLEYHYKILPVETGGENISYFFDDSKIDVDMDVKLVLRFESDADEQKNFYIERCDTLKVDFSEASIEKEDSKVSLSDNTMARVRIAYMNHLPVGCSATYWFVGEDFKTEILPELKGSLTIPAASVDESGVVSESSEVEYAYIKLNYEQYKSLTSEGRGMVFKYKVLNKELKNVWFKKNDWIDVTVDIWAKGFITYDANKNREE